MASAIPTPVRPNVRLRPKRALLTLNFPPQHHKTRSDSCMLLRWRSSRRLLAALVPRERRRAHEAVQQQDRRRLLPALPRSGHGHLQRASPPFLTNLATEVSRTPVRPRLRRAPPIRAIAAAVRRHARHPARARRLGREREDARGDRGGELESEGEGS